MRLIDEDDLLSRIKKINMHISVALQFREIILTQPTVEAIPVELIERKIEEYDRNLNYIKAEALTDLIYDWRKENE